MINRTATADLLKGIAALLMIQVHIIELFATNDIYNSGSGKVLLFLGATPVAPIFMIVFGYFIAASNKSTVQLLIRGFKIILLGLFLNIARDLNLIISVNKGIYNIDVVPYICGVDILPFAGLSLIIIALLKKIWKKNSIVVIVLIIITALSSDFLSGYSSSQPVLKYVFALFYGNYWWSYFPLLPWFAYPLTGIAFYKIKQRYHFNFLSSAKIKIILVILFALFMIATIQYGISIASTLPLYYHHGLLFFLWAVVFVSLYSFFINEIEQLFGSTILLKYLKWLGKHITIIYIIQWIIIGNIATDIYKTVSFPIDLLVSFIAILGVSSFICYLFIQLKEKYTTQTKIL